EHPLDDIVALIEDELTAVVAAHIVSIPTNGGNGTPRAATTSSTWHTMTSDQVLEELAITAAVGLPSSTAVERLASDGPNCLPRPEFRSPFAMLADQFVSAPVALLGASAVLSLFTGGLADAALIAGVVAVNGVIGFFT